MLSFWFLKFNSKLIGNFKSKKFGPDEDLEFLNVYLNDLNGYLFACRSMLESEDPQIFEDDTSNKVVQKKLVAFEKNQEKHGKVIFN